MIDLEKVTNEFLKYVQNYDTLNDDINRKLKHSFRVSKISTQIATGLNLKEEEIKLATLIGLLHDIGRFNQAKEFGSYDDLISFDHGDFGADLLKKTIRNYISTDIYNSIIFSAVKNHNKYSLAENLNDTEKLFCKIIRDADKLDIFYEATEIFWSGKENIVSESEITDYTLNFVVDKKTIINNKSITNESLDNVIKILALTFDLNFKVSFEILNKKNYINLIINRFKYNSYNKKRINKIKEILDEYINSKI